MKRRHLAVAASLTWLGAFILSFVMMFVTAPTGDGFTRGLNRIMVFLGWQVAATCLAIFALSVGWGRFQERARIRLLSRLPAIVQGSLVALIVGFIMLVRFARAPASLQVPVESGPVIAPAVPPVEPAQPVQPSSPDAPPPRTETTPPPSVDPEPQAETSGPEVQSFGGIFRSGFEASHFYTMDGRGPWWLEADESVMERLNEFYVDGPGRAGGLQVALTVDGWLEEVGDELDAVGDFEYRFHVVSIESVRGLTPEEFELVLETVTR